jgi:hypothetical protein
MSGKTVLIMLFQVLFLLIPESLSGQNSKCLAVITEISGEVNVIKAGKTESEKVYWGTQLFQGDQIRTSEKSVVSLLLANSNLVKLGANSTMIISTKESPAAVKAGNIPEPMTAAMISGFNSMISRKKEVKEEKGSLAGYRSINIEVKSIRLTAPYNTLIRTIRPSFSWNSKETYDSYTVSVYNTGGLVWSKKTSANSMKYPDDVKELEYGGSYFWTVEGEKMIDSDRSAKLGFSVLSFEKSEEITALENTMRNNLGSESEKSNLHSVLGAYFMRVGLLQDAANEFHIISEINPDDALPHELLGSIYSEMGDKDRAIEELQKALMLTKNKDTGDLLK